MPRRRPAAAAVVKVDPTLTPVAEIIGTFCGRHLNAEYARLGGKALWALAARLPAGELARGKPGAWAAGIIHAVGQHNFLGAPSSRPHLRSEEIPPGCGVSVATMQNRARVVRDVLFAGGPLSGFEFFTKARLRALEPIFQTMKALDPEALGSLGDATLGEIFDDAGVGPRDEPPPSPRVGKRGGKGKAAPTVVFADAINLASLGPGPSKPTRRGGEFVDAERDAMHRYYDLQEKHAADGPRRSRPRAAALERELRALIAADPDFYDPYLWLRDLLRREGGRPREAEAAELLTTAQTRAVARVPSRGVKWPARLTWGWLENRHLLRTFLNHALAEWEAGRMDVAAEEFARLLALDPEDHAGARLYLLGVREGMTWTEHRARFEKGGFISDEVLEWFEKTSGKYPEDFAAWREAADAGG